MIKLFYLRIEFADFSLKAHFIIDKRVGSENRVRKN